MHDRALSCTKRGRCDVARTLLLAASSMKSPILRSSRRSVVPFCPIAACAFALAVVTACQTTESVDVPAQVATGTTPAADGGAAPEASFLDAARPTDATRNDGKCHPVSSADLQKASYAPPTGGSQNLCSDELINAYVECQKGDDAACAKLDGDAGASCLSCIETKRNAPAWGPILVGPFGVNEAGCGALNNADTGTTGCGQGLADYTACLQYTCRSQCPGADYFDCATEARNTVCKSYVNALKSTCTEDVSACFAQNTDTVDTLVTRIIRRFCGSP